jgi:pyruvate dehydrogenase E1 component alpha subunit/2-oxoisovalerate dehydrogenase E1 component alpha subunit
MMTQVTPAQAHKKTARTSGRALDTPPSGVAAYFAGDEDAKALGLLSILGPDGTAEEASLPIGLDAPFALRLYRGLLSIRIMDERLLALQRQGRIGFYGEARGQEAAVIGSAAALEDGDWIVPALREAGVGLFRGMSIAQYVAQIFGNVHDNSKGRQMPCHPCDRSVNYVPMSSCVASQLPHAMGIAWAMKLSGDQGKVVLGYLGDGGTSTADFHVAMNFAGLHKVPVVFFCQNNQWAISTPGSQQTASETVAQKGLAYGIESLRCDGNDVLAVLCATQYAVDKARRGEGATFIEALTYRVSAHSSSDDPTRYRDESVTMEWRQRRDPLLRMRTFLVGRGFLSEEQDASLCREIETEVREAIAAEEGVPPPALDSIVEDVFETVPRHLAEDLERVKQDLRR